MRVLSFEGASCLQALDEIYQIYIPLHLLNQICTQENRLLCTSDLKIQHIFVTNLDDDFNDVTEKSPFFLQVSLKLVLILGQSLSEFLKIIVRKIQN